jgi:hypothetical protein
MPAYQRRSDAPHDAVLASRWKDERGQHHRVLRDPSGHAWHQPRPIAQSPDEAAVATTRQLHSEATERGCCGPNQIRSFFAAFFEEKLRSW